MRLENLDDGSKLEAAWTEALSSSLAYFRALLSSSSSSAWKPVSVQPLTSSSTARDSGQSQAHESTIGRVRPNEVNVHRRSGKGGDVYRAVVEVDCGTDVNVDTFRGCLVTPETRPMWDRMVEEAVTVDLVDAHTRITRTKYRLGWPSSPRDVVTISKTLVDQTTLIDITTSLPRSRHEPAYLRPSPPYVRAQISLLAWCIQLPSLSNASELSPPEGKARITAFWSWNPKGAWAAGGGVPQHLPSLVTGLVDYVREGSETVPVLLGYGPDVSIGAVDFDTARETLAVGYAIVGNTEAETGLTRQVEFGLSSTQSWDVQIHVKTQHGEDSPSTAWSSFVGQAPAPGASSAPKRLILRFAHAALAPGEELVRVRVSIERTSANGGVRINGIPVTIEPMRSTSVRRPLLDETASTSGISLRTLSTVASEPKVVRKPQSSKEAANERNIASLIKRNYIYFTSLLQEPEAKWRPVADSRGVAVHQLNSIDKTLVVFRAEAVFVGVGIWDLFATIATPGARLVWDKTHDESVLLEDVNELSDLWHFKSRAAWPVAARDAVMLRTTYKSPSSVHIFGFSVDDNDLFPRIPPSIDPTIIRTQIDLQGWSVESLSPNTTQVTLLEQSDPRGWSNKSSIPQVMMNTLAGIGEFAIKHGAPPIATRFGGAKALACRYDVEQETFRVEYDAAEARRSDSSSTITAFPLPVAVSAGTNESETSSLNSIVVRPLSNIECEIRCDADKWASNIVIMIDPPPTTVSALKRHRLSSSGGGLWLTVEHDAMALKKDRVVVAIRRGALISGAKTTVVVNGSKIRVDIEDLGESDVQLLKKQKRSRPTRAPLDQPPALGTLRKKQSNLELSPTSIDRDRTLTPSTAYTRLAMPLARWYTAAAVSTKAAIIPMGTPVNIPLAGTTSVDAAVRALTQLARMHADRDGESTDPQGWQPVSERDGLKIEKRVVPHVSETFPIFRAGRIIEGFTAEEVSAAVSSLRADERFEKPVRLESYGHGITTSHVVAHTTFPFRGRSMLVATVVARVPDGPPPSPSATTSHTSISTIFHASSSTFAHDYDLAKINSVGLPSGNVILEGWILETIDPYSHEQYPIPSTRALYVAAVDYSGSMPLSVNNMLNASLPRSLLAVESMLKASGPPSKSRSPAMTVLAPEANASGPWSLEGVETDKIGIDQRNDENEYSLTVRIQPSNNASQTDGSLLPGLRHADSRTSVNSGRSTVIDLAEDIRKSRRDLVICEVEVGNQMIKSGCDIKLEGVSLPSALHYGSGDSTFVSFTLPEGRIDLPFKCSVILLAPSLLQSASLDPTGQPRHLLRITLPTSAYDVPISDPLSNKAQPLPRPRWLLDLINDGAVVKLSMRAKREGDPTYTFGGIDLVVEDEKKNGRGTPREGRSKLPQLVNRSVPNAMSLSSPLAIAKEYLSETTVPPPRPPSIITNEDASTVAPEPEQTEQTREVQKPLAVPEPIKRYSFWKYPNLRLGRNNTSVLTTTAETSPATANVLTLVPEEDTKPPSPVGVGSARDQLSQPIITLPGLIIACLVCLLIGSLLRSLLSEADFVVYSSPGGRAGTLTEGEHWRELKRILEWRIGWDRVVILAIARRG